MVVLYSKAGCVQCVQTKKYLDRHDVPYTARMIDEDPQALAYVQQLGAKSAPVIVDGDTWWQGLRPDRLATLRDRVPAH